MNERSEVQPASVAATGRVWRVAYPPDPWAWVPWEYAPFHGRFDDARGQFRVLYAGTDRLACYLEVTAQFRPDLTVLAELDAVLGDPQDDGYPEPPHGLLPVEWLAARTLGSATISGTYVQIAAKESLAWLRPRMASRLVHFNVPDLDGAAIRSTVPRRLTQEISTLLYATQTAGGGHPDGVRFESRHGEGLTLYAIYERPSAGDTHRSRLLAATTNQALAVTDPELAEAARLHGLTIG